MAINKQEFTEKVDTNLKSNKDATRFYINFRIGANNRYEKVLDYSDKGWTKTDRKNKAKAELLAYKEKVKSSTTNINDKSTLNQVSEMYFNQKPNTNWTKELKNVYRVHIEPTLGKKKIITIRKVDIDNLRISLEKKGKTKQNANGCAPRTIRKILVQTLKPILIYAQDNDIIYKIPKIDIPKQPTQTKLVKNPEETFYKLRQAIMEEYKDDAFYRSLFLFLLYGRRLNEVLTIEWKDIDLANSSYMIRSENNKAREDQFYLLAQEQVDALNDLDGTEGLVYKSDITGNKIYPPKRQMAKIKKASGVEDMTFHKFRHVLASALAVKEGVTAFQIAATLGHKDLTTASKHYITNETKKATGKMLELMDKTSKGV